jgi:hydrogenase-4 component F
MNLTLLLPVVAPLLAAAVAALRVTAGAWAGIVAAVAIAATGAQAAAETTRTGPVVLGVLRADALSAWMLLVVGAVAIVACWASVHYVRQDPGGHNRRYLILVQLFLAAMSLAVLADNLGLLWIAVEATTIVTAFLVGHRRTRASVEAAWKYVVLCSVGIAVAFLGTVCVYAAAVAAGSEGLSALNWTHLTAGAASLDHDLMRLAAGLTLLGFGTKAGLAPMHAWLPDAHSQAPAPVSALMSGVLLSVAFYAILRYKTIFDVVLGTGYVRVLLTIAALASLAVAAALLIAQQDYKRMLAYSSIEHMGLIALAAAIGSRLAVAAALLHILGHGLAKAAAFTGAGSILHLYGSPRVDAVRAMATGRPVLAAAFGAALAALLGLPPFSLFSSELGIARAGLAGGAGWQTAAAFAIVLVAFAALVRLGTAMLLGTPGMQTVLPPGRSHAGPALAALAAAAVLGITLGPLQSVLDAAATIAGGLR